MMKANSSSSLVAGTITTPSCKATLHKKVLSLAIIQALACGSSALNAATIIVDSAADNVTVDGSCTLREAIVAANTNTGVDCTAGSGADTINFDNSLSGSTVTLGGTQLNIFESLSIDGDLNDDGTPDIEINANDLSRVIYISSASNAFVTLEGITISGGNTAISGGGVSSQFNYGSFTNVNLTISNSVISGNTSVAYGAGVYSSYGNSLTIYNSSISGNTTTNNTGGGVFAVTGALSLTNSTVSGNSANGAGRNGGGIATVFGDITLTNSTVSNNSATAEGGGIHVGYPGTLTLTNSTVSGNSANTGGGIYSADIDLNMVNSIIANNTGGDCGGAFGVINGSNSLVEDGGAACGITGVNITSLLTVDPQLGALADNGGPTQTHLPQVGSPVLDAGDNTNCGTGLTITTDQRGEARDDGMCDIGAVEGAAAPLAVASVQLDSTTATVSEDGSSITLNLTRSGDTVSAISVDYSTSDGTATAPADYTADTNTLDFATGITNQSVTIDITDDSDVESDEDFTLTLSNVRLVSGSASVELGANAATTVTITDDDTDDSSSSNGLLGLSPWWSVLMLTGWLRRRFGA